MGGKLRPDGPRVARSRKGSPDSVAEQTKGEMNKTKGGLLPDRYVNRIERRGIDRAGNLSVGEHLQVFNPRRIRVGGGRRESHLRGGVPRDSIDVVRSEEHTSELQSRLHLVCRLLLEKK